MPKAVFISHIVQEKGLAQAVKRFIHAILEPDAVEVFLSSDIFSLSPGEHFEEKIRQKILDCDLFIGMCSDASFKAHWLHLEMGAAWVNQKPIVSICYGGRDKGSLPRPYSSLHAMNLSDPYHLTVALYRVLTKSRLTPPPYDGLPKLGIHNEGTKPYEELNEALRRTEERPAIEAMVLPVSDALTPEERTRLDQARRLLAEGAALARAASEGNVRFDRANHKSQLRGAYELMLGTFYSFTVYSDFRHMEIQNQERRKRERVPNSEEEKFHFQDVAAHLDELAKRLTIDDLDDRQALPPSFSEYLSGWNPTQTEARNGPKDTQS